MLLDGIRSNASQSWGVKLAFGLIIVVFVFWGIGSVQAPTGVVATVNDSQISMREFQRVYSRMMQDIQRAFPNVTQEEMRAFQIESIVLNQLITQKVLEEESARTGINLSVADFQNAIITLPYFHNSEGQFDKALYEQMIEQSGQSVTEFEASIRAELLPQYMQTLFATALNIQEEAAFAQYEFISQMRSIDYVLFAYDASAQKVNEQELLSAYEVQKNSFIQPARIAIEYIHFDPETMAEPNSILDAEVQDVYLARESQFRSPEQVHVRHLLLQIPQNAPEAEENAVLEQIKALEARIRAGENFEEIASEFGQGGSQENGGELGWLAKNQMMPAFADAAFALGIGELSAPVRTNFGYHLIFLEGKKDAFIATFEEVKEDLRLALAEEKIITSLQDIVDTALIDLSSGKSFQEVAQSYNLDVINSELLTEEELSDNLGFDTSVIRAFMSAKADTLWDSPVPFGNGLLAVRIVNVDESKTKALEEVRDIIHTQIAMEKAKNVAIEAAKTAISLGNEKAFDKSEFFTRRGEIPLLGTNRELTKEIFASDDKNWKQDPYVLDGGVAIVRLAEIQNASLEDFNTIKQGLMAELLNAKSEVAFQRYMAMLRNEAKIQIVMPELFAQTAN